MIDLHTHTLFSDGELLPSELVRRAKAKGYKAIGISDHADSTNIEIIVAGMLRLKKELKHYKGINVVPGIEITHAPRGLIGELAAFARKLGVSYVVVHGETIVEPVEQGTNRAAIEAGADILAHPGLITEEDVVMAKKTGTFLEITSRKGHSLTNGHVARLAKKIGARMLLNTDSHSPSDLISGEDAKRVALGAGLSLQDFDGMQKNAMEFVKRVTKRGP
ncbi:MAG TPA: histidinol phosphate phosphatase domain-containing protein [Syntrophorhabdaceae bacterium]|nr:histidinol phosphate phosphatase domain-containing protein [Syntrophorhabdaceae bacterium]HQM82508.1 histidinol phosphate phosphatase domain-containing protein [Syntrophorhabdaceae bacterium]